MIKEMHIVLMFYLWFTADVSHFGLNVNVKS